MKALPLHLSWRSQWPAPLHSSSARPPRFKLDKPPFPLSATLLDPTVPSDCGITVSQADLAAAVASSPGGDSRCGDIINVQFGDASVNLTVAYSQMNGLVRIKITEAAYTALMAPVGPITVAWEFFGGDES
ncbi:hypothetical protein FB451DRAFT_1183053 [Mycena latifolia]|nr:hypothetical protein FB451DRAFT_1183053 [Mycena latifolia]